MTFFNFSLMTLKHRTQIAISENGMFYPDIWFNIDFDCVSLSFFENYSSHRSMFNHHHNTQDTFDWMVSNKF